jgi:hypothetical protein
MTISGDLDYAHGRLSARFAERPDELAWRSIEAIRAFPALLDAARGLGLRRWLTGIAADSNAHAIEAALVASGRALVVEVARWMPARWQASVEWVGVLAELPVIEHIARRGETLPWMREDALYGSLHDRARPSAESPLAPLAAGWQRPDGLFPAWRDEWRRRLPSVVGGSAALEALSRTLATQRSAADASIGAASLRAALAARLASLFRRAILDPASAFIFLGLSALDAERLRGELLRRAIFPALRLAT